MRKIVSTGLMGLAAAGLMACGDVHHAKPSRPAVISTTNVPDGRIHEDDPRWDCLTMGNRLCGRGGRLNAQMANCQQSFGVRGCHVETDSDGSQSVYGQNPAGTATRAAK